ncbi:unnamed protein product [Bursaphelenchus okinawaensis]|uniref:Uncharacterized protein n=1 Tax=Bursaphelenchus okinawaensis TaxID=465554 RepID=A0A811LDK4_9BILA|nr:unnamed protein product [Bursaphelenchus okinawaensis]CAG9121277.1 unnamed protein product [Bursaphelenchus okinawaensis]
MDWGNLSIDYTDDSSTEYSDSSSTITESTTVTSEPVLSVEEKVIGLYVSIGVIILFYVILIVIAVLSLIYRVKYLNETVHDIFCGKKPPKEVIIASTKTAHALDEVTAQAGQAPEEEVKEYTAKD